MCENKKDPGRSLIRIPSARNTLTKVTLPSSRDSVSDGISTFLPADRWLPRFHRAGPSTALDKSDPEDQHV